MPATVRVIGKLANFGCDSLLADDETDKKGICAIRLEMYANGDGDAAFALRGGVAENVNGAGGGDDDAGGGGGIDVDGGERGGVCGGGVGDVGVEEGGVSRGG